MTQCPVCGVDRPDEIHLDWCDYEGSEPDEGGNAAPYVDPRVPDPAFPNRPTHPDFALLSDAIQEIDARIDSGDATVHDLTAGVVDVESLTYIAVERAKIASKDPSDLPLVAGGILDGFMLGVAFARAKAVEA